MTICLILILSGSLVLAQYDNRYTIVEVATGRVVNIAVWDGKGKWKENVEKDGKYRVQVTTPTDQIWIPLDNDK